MNRFGTFEYIIVLKTTSKIRPNLCFQLKLNKLSFYQPGQFHHRMQHTLYTHTFQLAISLTHFDFRSELASFILDTWFAINYDKHQNGLKLTTFKTSKLK